MGFSESAAQSILFIAAIVLAVAVAGTLTANVSQFTGNLDARSSALNNEMSTDIRIINDPGDVPNNPLILYVLNTGTRALATSESVALINGQADTSGTFDVMGSTDDDTWRSGEVLEITFAGQNLAGGQTHRVKVIAQYGVSDTLRFSL